MKDAKLHVIADGLTPAWSIYWLAAEQTGD